MQQPPFGSSIILELRQDSNGTGYVQFMYKNNSLNAPISLQPLNIKGFNKL